jgi:ATP-binding cassette subfamily B protein
MTSPYRRTWASWRPMAHRFRPYRIEIVATLVLVVLATGLTVISPLLLVQIINQALPEHNARLLGLLCGTLLLLAVITNGAVIAQNALTNWVGQRIIHQLRTDLFDTVQRMPLHFFSAESNSEIQSRMVSDIGGISDIITFTAQSTVGSVVSLASCAIVMVVLSWPLALVSLALALVLNLTNSRFTKRRRLLATQRQERVSEMLVVVAEDLSLPGVILSRTLGRQVSQQERFAAASDDVATLTYQQRLAGNSARVLIGMTLGCVPPLIYWLSGTVFTGLSVGTVVVLALLQLRVSTPIQQLLGLSASVQSASAMAERITAYLSPAVELEPVPAPAESRPARRHPAPPLLRASQVSYDYPSSRQRALSDVSVEFPPGSITVVTGATGSGKSTLALILAGLIAPSAGAVHLGPDVAALADLRREVMLISQDAAMLNASIAENLLFAEPDAAPADLDRALRIAQLDTWVASLPDGIDTQIGERGYEVSGGERQRIALARAMLSASPVFILDEATSALDSATADAVNTALRQHCPGRTLIMISHRTTYVEAGDRILVIGDGRVAQEHTASSTRKAVSVLRAGG